MPGLTDRRVCMRCQGELQPARFSVRMYVAPEAQSRLSSQGAEVNAWVCGSCGAVEMRADAGEIKQLWG